MRTAYRFRFVPPIIGLMIAFMGFVNFSSASIPYQDPTPELYQQYLREVSIAKLWMVISAALFFVGLVYVFVITSVYKKRAAAEQKQEQ